MQVSAQQSSLVTPTSPSTSSTNLIHNPLQQQITTSSDRTTSTAGVQRVLSSFTAETSQEESNLLTQLARKQRKKSQQRHKTVHSTPQSSTSPIQLAIPTLTVTDLTLSQTPTIAPDTSSVNIEPVPSTIIPTQELDSTMSLSLIPAN
jgi:hypothetical protein